MNDDFISLFGQWLMFFGIGLMCLSLAAFLVAAVIVMVRSRR